MTTDKLPRLQHTTNNAAAWRLAVMLGGTLTGALLTLSLTNKGMDTAFVTLATGGSVECLVRGFDKRKQVRSWLRWHGMWAALPAILIILAIRHGASNLTIMIGLLGTILYNVIVLFLHSLSANFLYSDD